VHDDLVLYIHEPTPELIFESYEVYDDAYDEAYRKGVFVKQEIIPILLENDYWSPLDDKEAERLQKEIENKKLECFQNFVHKKQLLGLKRELARLQSLWGKATSKKFSLDNITCSGTASYTRSVFMIEKTTKFADGSPYDWKQVSVSTAARFYRENSVPEETLREIARSEPWRGMWNGGKGTQLFGVPFSKITALQSRLCSYSRMYDSVFEHPESPNDKIIEDDDCLDGWFIFQKRKREKEKKQSEIDGMITNEKIRNSDEIYVVAQNREDASEIYNINDPTARNIIRERDEKIAGKEGMKFTELNDVQRQLQVERNKKFTDTMRSNRT
tara:strand:+ start:2347 stop:3333 length:987 start_codon:yes stop_codon:yes gene_type:complete